MDWLWCGIAAWGAASFGFGLGWIARNAFGPSDDWKHNYLSGILALFHEGGRAYTAGNPEFSNPYLDDYGRTVTPEARAWFFGYIWEKERSKT